jgi:hypothetical protein
MEIDAEAIAAEGAEGAAEGAAELNPTVEEDIQENIEKLSKIGELDNDKLTKVVINSLEGPPGKVSVTKITDDGKSIGMGEEEVNSLKSNIEELNQKIIDTLKGGKSISEAFEELQTERWTPSDGGAGIKDYIEKKSIDLSNNLNKLDPSIKPVEVLKNELEKKGVTTPMNDPPENPTEFSNNLEEAANATAEKTTKIAKYFEESQTAEEAKEISETGKTTGKKMSYPKWLKALGMFTVMGEIGYAMWAFLEFAKANTGCMMISNDGQNPETSEKVFCSGDITYQAQQCMCVKVIPSPPPSTSLCGSSTDTTRTPEINNRKCINYADLTPPYVYYSYKVTTPIGGILDIGSRIAGAAQSAAGGFLTIITKYLKLAGLAILGAGILYILYILVKLGIRHYEK